MQWCDDRRWLRDDIVRSWFGMQLARTVQLRRLRDDSFIQFTITHSRIVKMPRFDGFLDEGVDEEETDQGENKHLMVSCGRALTVGKSL